jgi:transcription antitermination factor NusG
VLAQKISAESAFPAAPDRDERHWFAAYTCAKHEKIVTRHLVERSVESFLPEYESLRHWKDRKVKLRMPLFPGYVFVRLALSDRSRVLHVPSLVRLVGFSGQPSIVPDEEIRALQLIEAAGIQPQPYPYLHGGERVRIVRGPLEGVEGIVSRRKNKLRLVLSLDLITRSVAVEVDQTDIAIIPLEVRSNRRTV